MNIPDNILILSHHRKQTFQRCRLKHFFHYELRRQRPNNNVHLILGTAIHKALEYYYSKSREVELNDLIKLFRLHMIMDNASIDFQIELGSYAELGIDMLTRYYAVTQTQEHFKVIRTETPFMIGIMPDGRLTTKLETAYTIFAGKVDLVMETDNKIFLMDHKTTSQDKDNFESSMSTDEQLLDYSVYGRMIYGERFSGVVYNGLNKNLTPTPIFRSWHKFSNDEVDSAIDNYLQVATEYYTFREHPQLMRTRSQQSDCFKCPYLDASLAFRRKENWEQVLDLYSEPIQKMDWEE